MVHRGLGNGQVMSLVSVAVGFVVIQGCACSVETSTRKPDSGNDDATSSLADGSTETQDTASRDAGRGGSGDSNQIDVTLDDEDAGRIDVTLDGLDAGSNDASATDAAPSDASSKDASSNDADTRDAGVSQCSTVFSTCEDGVIHTCSALGELEQTFACSNGCDVESHECLPLQLDSWFVYQFELTDDSVQTAASYMFEENGLVAVQTANPLPSAYINDVVVENFVARGKVSVTTSSDDDMFGFVFGWQDPQHFYMVDWKQGTQDAPPCGLAPAGVALKLVNSDTPLETCLDFWSGTGSEKVTPLVAPTGPGWSENTVYDFELVFRPGDIRLTITAGDALVVDLVSEDTTYTSGLFGFYNYSQEGVRYEFFTLEPAP